jgi:hypothetical protein
MKETVRPELVKGLWMNIRWFDKFTTNCWAGSLWQGRYNE